MFSRRNVLALLSLSLLLLAVPAWAQQGLAERAEKAATKAEFLEFLDRVEPELKDADWLPTVKASLEKFGLATAKREFRSHITADVVSSSTEVSGKVKDANQEAKDILSNPAYRDGGTTHSNNWLAKAGEAVGEWLAKMLAELFKMFRPQDVNFAAPNLTAGAVAARVFMVILVLALIAFLIFFAFKMSRGRKLRRKAGGLLDDDEPDRTADEWLQQADLLTGQGRFREAVRCLYIACLVRFDDAGVAGFDRGQTNWEHLYRIAASPKKPPGLDFRKPTQAFDQFWYGYAPINEGDVAEFRKLYDGLLHDLGIRNAA